MIYLQMRAKLLQVMTPKYLIVEFRSCLIWSLFVNLGCGALSMAPWHMCSRIAVSLSDHAPHWPSETDAHAAIRPLFSVFIGSHCVSVARCLDCELTGFMQVAIRWMYVTRHVTLGRHQNVTLAGSGSLLSTNSAAECCDCHKLMSQDNTLISFLSHQNIQCVNKAKSFTSCSF